MAEEPKVEGEAPAGPVPRGRRRWRKSRVPEGSLFYTRVVPLLLVIMGLLMIILILVALGILLGWVPWQ